MALRAPPVLTVTAKPHRGSLPPWTGHRALFQPSVEPSVPAPVILHGCWPPALSKELLCWFVHPALSVVSECMFRVVDYLGPRERKFQHPGCVGLEGEKTPWLEQWATLAPVGLEGAIPCPQRPLYLALFHRADVYLYPCHAVGVLNSHICFNFRYFMLFACWCKWLEIQCLVEKGAQWW